MFELRLRALGRHTPVANAKLVVPLCNRNGHPVSRFTTTVASKDCKHDMKARVSGAYRHRLGLLHRRGRRKRKDPELERYSVPGSDLTRPSS